jgi:thermitase
MNDGPDIYDVVHSLCGLDTIIWAEPNSRVKPCARPNDNLYREYQWNLKAENYGIDCETAWDVTTGNRQIKIGVIGSGIDPSHPDLLDKVAGGHNYNDNVHNDNWGDDGHNDGHETKVAGIIAARTNNQIGLAGITGG